MDVKGIRLLERVGEAGLRRVLRDGLDRAGLVQLANVCRVTLPGQRAQTVPDARLIDELIKKFLEDGAARAAVMKTLGRANGDVAARLQRLTPAERAREAVHLFETQAGRALFALAQEPGEAAHAALSDLLRRLPGGEAPQPSAAEPAGAPGQAPPEEAARPRALQEEIEALRGRLTALEQARDRLEASAHEAGRREAALRDDLVAAHKESHHLRKELARAEAERDRVSGESQALSRRLEERERSAAAAQVEDVSVRLNQLIRETRKIAHDVEEMQRARAGSTDTTRPYLDALGSSIDALRRELADLRRWAEEEARKTLRAAQDAVTEARAARSEIVQMRRAAAEPAPRRRGEPDRVGLFVDVQNMYYAARQLNARLDFGALMTAATRDRRLIRALAYVVQNPDIDQSAFLAMLQQRNYEVRRKDLRIRMDGSSKGDWDMEIALDILHLAESLDVVVLASGDGDFTSLVHQIKTRGPKVEVYSFPGSTARELVEASDRYVPLDEGFLIRLAPTVRTD